MYEQNYASTQYFPTDCGSVDWMSQSQSFARPSSATIPQISQRMMNYTLLESNHRAPLDPSNFCSFPNPFMDFSHSQETDAAFLDRCRSPSISLLPNISQRQTRTKTDGWDDPMLFGDFGEFLKLEREIKSIPEPSPGTWLWEVGPLTPEQFAEPMSESLESSSSPLLDIGIFCESTESFSLACPATAYLDSISSRPSMLSNTSLPSITPAEQHFFFFQDERYEDLTRPASEHHQIKTEGIANESLEFSSTIGLIRRSHSESPVSYDLDPSFYLHTQQAFYESDETPSHVELESLGVESSIGPISRAHSDSPAPYPVFYRHTPQPMYIPEPDQSASHLELVFQLNEHSVPSDTAENPVKKTTKQPAACLFCRKRKVKCDRKNATEEDPRCTHVIPLIRFELFFTSLNFILQRTSSLKDFFASYLAGFLATRLRIPIKVSAAYIACEFDDVPSIPHHIKQDALWKYLTALLNIPATCPQPGSENTVQPEQNSGLWLLPPHLPPH
ncbi:hypothetical protein C8J56DRAFT_1064298 [Mycena floridula]|nr:hypothetical protein C8J56DRAFT_1064298 [Mycena floridula]